MFKINREKLIKFLKSRVFAVSVAGALCLICGLYISSYQSAVEVFVNGQSIGYVTDETQFNDIKTAAKELIYNNDFELSALTAKSVFIKNK